MRVEEACAWIADDYPSKMLRLVHVCEQAAAKGFKRVRRGDVFLLAGMSGLSISECKEFKFDNTLWSSLSRYLLMFRPSLAAVIFPKYTEELDAVDFAKVWHETVEPGTFFYANSWQEAVAAHKANDASCV